MGGLPGLFDVDVRLKRLSDLGDQLLGFAGAVDFEIFRADLDRALGYCAGARGGRPPFDPVLMFKILVIQAANNLSDERAEFLINDRLSQSGRSGARGRVRSGCLRAFSRFRFSITRCASARLLLAVTNPSRPHHSWPHACVGRATWCRARTRASQNCRRSLSLE